VRPSYSITPKSLWALDVLIEEGYRYDTSIFPIRHDRYGIPVSPRHAYTVTRPGRIARGNTRIDGQLRSAEPSGCRRRLFPNPSGTPGRDGASRASTIQRGCRAVFYLHPWEIDPGQPRLPAGLLGRFRHYRNLMPRSRA
jgi:hypothetical protein